MASAIIWPICWSWLAEEAPTWATSLEESTFLAHAAELIDDRLDGEVDAALDLRGVGARGDVLQALGEDRLGVDRWRWWLPSPATGGGLVGDFP
jgi:hypothetical protein